MEWAWAANPFVVGATTMKLLLDPLEGLGEEGVFCGSGGVVGE
jgi:hypothetical protein